MGSWPPPDGPDESRAGAQHRGEAEEDGRVGDGHWRFLAHLRTAATTCGLRGDGLSQRGPETSLRAPARSSTDVRTKPEHPPSAPPAPALPLRRRSPASTKAPTPCSPRLSRLTPPPFASSTSAASAPDAATTPSSTPPGSSPGGPCPPRGCRGGSSVSAGRGRRM